MQTELRVAGADDLAAVTDVISAAFHADPAWSWAFPDATRRAVQYDSWWRLFVAGALRFPWTWVAGPYAAVSVWIPPGEAEMTPEQEDRVEPLLVELLGATDAQRVLEMAHRFESNRPVEPHFYLSLLGTAPAFRGHGTGVALLAANLSSIDTEGAPAYLESTNPANLARYERLGFEPRGEFATGGDGSPVVTTMWRPARPA